MAMAALNLGPDDLVIVPSLTFLATANAVRFTGADVVFADVDSETGLLGADNVRAAADRVADPSRIRAVVAVHLGGQCVDLEALHKLCLERGWTLVEDACHAIGGTFCPAGFRQKSTPVGSCAYSKLSTFSFHPVKTVTSAEGGAVTTRDSDLADRLRNLRNHGMIRNSADFENSADAFDAEGAAHSWYYEMHQPMPNYRLSDLHCALGHSQLGRLADFVSRRRQLVARYDAGLATLHPHVQPVHRVGNGDPAWHLYAVLVDFMALGTGRGEVLRRLAKNNIGAQVHYYPVHRQPYYRKRYGEIDLSGCDKYYARELSLPLFPTMQDADIDRIVGAMTQIVETRTW